MRSVAQAENGAPSAALPVVPMVAGHDRWFHSRIFTILLETLLSLPAEPVDSAAVGAIVRRCEALLVTDG
jgi:hypothetical protein